jgi:hypothetical protein
MAPSSPTSRGSARYVGATCGTADREMCEYAAEYLAPQHKNTSFNPDRV